MDEHRFIRITYTLLAEKMSDQIIHKIYYHVDRMLLRRLNRIIL